MMRRSAFTLLVVPAFADCSDSPVDPVPRLIDEGTGVVNATGGVLPFEGYGLTLNFPQDAVPGETRITVERVQETADGPVPAYGLEGHVFKLGPDGLEFERPVELTIEYDPSVIPSGFTEEHVRIHRQAADATWTPVSEATADAETHTVSGIIGGFSYYAVVGFATPRSAIEELTHQYSHEAGGRSSSAEVGIWMFCEDPIGIPRRCQEPARLVNTNIADWLHDEDQPVIGYQRTVILEPINVLWIDYSAKDQATARGNVRTHLRASRFFVEGPPKHSYGYGGWLAGVMQPQSPPEAAWVDSVYPNPNNHGRVFESVNVGSEEEPVFYTLGGFSRETGPTVYGLHLYVSFRDAQEAAYQRNTDEWDFAGIDRNWGNVFNDLTTGDHIGVAVLVRGDNDGDGIWNRTDECPDLAGTPEDCDGDGVPDAEEAAEECVKKKDCDGDSEEDSIDLCPTDPTNSCKDDDGNGGGDGGGGGDRDGDGIPDGDDFCPDDPDNVCSIARTCSNIWDGMLTLEFLDPQGNHSGLEDLEWPVILTLLGNADLGFHGIGSTVDFHGYAWQGFAWGIDADGRAAISSDGQYLDGAGQIGVSRMAIAGARRMYDDGAGTVRALEDATLTASCRQVTTSP